MNNTNNKISTVLTQTKYGDEESGVNCILQWSAVVPKILVCGPIKPLDAFGVRYLGKDPKSLRWLMAAYMGLIPGGETVAILAPTFTISKDQTKLFEEVHKQRIAMAWASFVKIGGVPRAFIMSSSVCAHLLMQIPNTLHVTGNDWAEWMNDWLDRHMMQPRYIDATGLGVLSAITPEPNEEVLNAYDVTSATSAQPAKRVIGKPFQKRIKKPQDAGASTSNIA